ncbi:GDSL-type esterase/lipase family protein [Streptomyces phaeochromogenes]|uniref:GDSL-type esterase/lipase family protein n=1 Tax=Streptomyces phaeochromogenes TaxID=1923 RepID=A0ABZ1HR62_STRPH|nr:GDSL-type esterase/lipase family protein [Streptomyces phaeochromogenes]MCX5599269.1 GDSL-type esterase/lipase family protein [Streptomyces phaeochromogenes]WSD20088.1 GDSL-type esterase/lipase family protein [Streptomyces phaeochromogenes]WSJ03243.1 GDSL-type esterase/lipase family protein [Streptomyces phaeochromogenes]
MAVPARPHQVLVPSRFRIEAASRHPRLGRDYDPATHSYRASYVNPAAYTITVDAFPGKTLLFNKGDIQHRPGTDPRDARDIWRLDGPKDTTGWQFKIEGRPARKMPFGPRPPRFTAEHTTRLVTMKGEFHEDRDTNAWNWHINVPGPGTYVVAVTRLRGANTAAPRVATLDVEDLLVVSIGDSAASGQGNPDVPGEPRGFDPDLSFWDILNPASGLFKLTKAAVNWAADLIKTKFTSAARLGDAKIAMDPAPVWLEPLAYRSLRSGPAHAARLLEDRGKGRLITFLSFGRTDSTILNGLIGPRRSDGRPGDRWAGNLGQLDELARTIGRRHIHAVLIYIGVNDVGVSGNLTDLVAADLVGSDTLGDPTRNRKAVEARAKVNLAALPEKIQTLATALTRLDVGQVYLTEYPTSLFDDAAGNPQAGCGVFTNPGMNLSRQDAVLVKSLAEKLNAALKAAATAHGWFYVSGIAAAFKGHGYCAGKTFFVGAEESMLLQGDTEGMVHPNPEGSRIIGEMIAAAVRQHTVNTPRPGSHGPQGPLAPTG